MMKRRQRGATTVEMTLVGIPIMFTLISTFEISRGMWNYHTVSHAVKEGVRYAIVHGVDCGTIGPINNACQVNMGGGPVNGFKSIAQVIQDAGVGLEPAKTKLRFCAPAPCASNAPWTCTMLTNCAATTWPPAGSNGPGQPIEIDITTEFHSMAALWWPGTQGAGVSFAATNFLAISSDKVQF